MDNEALEQGRCLSLMQLSQLVSGYCWMREKEVESERLFVDSLEEIHFVVLVFGDLVSLALAVSSARVLRQKFLAALFVVS